MTQKNKIKKQKYQVEFEFRSSPKILYSYISNPSGLSDWFADDVSINPDGIYTFHWDKSEAKARIINKKENKYVRFKWLDDTDEETYFEFDIVLDDLTEDVALIITDFAKPEEIRENERLWHSEVQNLMKLLGS
jgi:uncharacterized protein YndB with AHSA1/START domain